MFPCPAIRPAGHCPYVHHRHTVVTLYAPDRLAVPVPYLTVNTFEISPTSSPEGGYQGVSAAVPDCSSHHAPSGHCDLMALHTVYPAVKAGRGGNALQQSPEPFSSVARREGMTISMSQAAPAPGNPTAGSSRLRHQCVAQSDQAKPVRILTTH